MSDPLVAAVLDLTRRATGVADLAPDGPLDGDGARSAAALVAAVLDPRADPVDLAAARTAEAMAARLGATRAPADEPRAGAAEPVAGAVPASPGQTGLWLADQYAPGSTAYNGPFLVRVPERLDPDAVHEAARRVVSRHSVLRTVLRMEDGTLLARVDDRPVLAFSCRTYRDEDELAALVREIAAVRIDLADGPMLHLRCAHGPDGGSVLVCNIHHVASDARSATVFLGELAERYSEVVEGVASPDRTGLPQYADFVAWHADRIAGPELERLLDDVDERIGSARPPNLPVDRPRPAGTAIRPGAVETFDLSASELDALDDLAATTGTTLFAVVLAAYQLLLAAHEDLGGDGDDDLLVGSPVSLRGSTTEDMIGYFVNLVVLRARLDPRSTVRELLAATRAEIGEALRTRHAPYEKLLERRAARGGADAPVTTMLVLTAHDSGTVDWRGSRVRVDRDLEHDAKYDLSLILEPGSEGLHGTVEYATDVLDPASVRSLLVRYRELLALLAAHPDRPIAELPVATAAERAVLRAEGDRTAEAGPAVAVGRLLADRATRTPDAPALESGTGPQPDTVLTHAELHVAATRLARDLRAHGATTGERVALLLPRSVTAVVALVAVVHSGAAFVPVDPDYPAERVTDMLGDADVRLVVTDSATAARLEGPAPAPLLVLDGGAGADARDPGCSAPVDEAPKDVDAPAYVVYTSGSTGRPKGVVITDRTVANLLRVQDELSPVGAHGRTLQFMSLSFDVSIMEILGTLYAGGTVTVVPEDLRVDLHALVGLLRDRGLSRLYLPYIALQKLAAIAVEEGTTMPALREVASVGEQLVVTPAIRAFFAAHPQARLLNMYGPSETHLATSEALVGPPADWPDNPAVGPGISGLDLLVLDRAGTALVPPGVAGELHIGGPLISPGYHRRPDETAARFVPHPEEGRGDRVYRTGDVVRRRSDGALEYLGRRDDQLKIRGFRVEPAEVEAAVAELPGIHAAAVVAVPTAAGRRSLVAFVVGTDVDPDRSRSNLARTLPEHLVPARIVPLAALPIGPSGKVDRQALPALDTASASSDGPAEPPRGPVEESVARWWTELLGVPTPDRDHDFFSLGGHSLLATELVYRLRQEHDVELPLRALLDRPTVAGMAEALVAASTGADAAPEIDLGAEVVLDPAVRGGTPPLPTADARAVLLTGATGFLGAFVLRELLERTDATVHALVRAPDVAAATARLAETAAAYRLPVPDPARVVAVPGDVAAERLGLPAGDYARLLAAVDAVYHVAARINFVEPYASVRPTNVDGLRHVLAFATDGRVKPVHYTSTIAVFSPEETRAEITEDDEPVEHRGLGIGYTRSKWVAERLALEARDRGVPVSVYRIGRISGDTRTGACQAADFLWRQVKSVIQVGTAPPGESLHTDLLPVDFVARAVVGLSRTGTAARVHHLFHPTGADFRTVYDGIRACGFGVEIEPAEDWLARIERAASAPGGSALAAAVPLFREGALELGHNVYRNARTAAALEAIGLGFPEIHPTAISRMIRFFQRSGELSASPQPVG